MYINTKVNAWNAKFMLYSRVNAGVILYMNIQERQNSNLHSTIKIFQIRVTTYAKKRKYKEHSSFMRQMRIPKVL